ncbi:MAG: hypothetical protein ABW124_00010 [Candidatus Thiodiazotropha sp. 6PLUC9]
MASVNMWCNVNPDVTGFLGLLNKQRYILFVFCLLLGVLPPSFATAATIYVDDDGSNALTDGTATYPYHSIADALVVAAPGDSISVAPGRYEEPSPLLDFAVSIAAEEPLLSTIVLTDEPWRVEANGVSITGLRFTGPSSVTAINSITTVNVEHCQFEGMAYGIWINGAAAGGWIKHNRFLGTNYPVVALGTGTTIPLMVWNNVLVASPSSLGIGIMAYNSRFQAFHNHINGFTWGIYANGYLDSIPTSFAVQNLIVDSSYGVRASQIDAGHILVYRNAISAAIDVSGVPDGYALENFDATCGATGAPFSHAWQPGPACVDAGHWYTDPDGTVADIGPYGGPYGGNWYEQVNCIGDSTLLTCPVHPVDNFLIANTAAADAVVFWDGYDDGWVAWSNWSPELKQGLRDAYDQIATGTEPIEPTIKNAWQLNAFDEVRCMAVRDEDARRLYLSQIAGSLHTEVAGLVPWSILDLTDDATSLTALFDAREYYYETIRACVPLNGSYESVYLFEKPDGLVCADTAFRARSGGVIPMEASLTWDKLELFGFLGATRLETIEAVLQWERVNLIHFQAGILPPPAFVNEWYWTERSLPPAKVLLNGHVPVGPHPLNGTTTTHPHWSAGCGSVGYLVAALLRVANIPVTIPSIEGGDAGIHFPTEDAWISHGDSVPAGPWKYDTAYAASDILLNSSEWAEWFPISNTTYFESPMVYSGAHLGLELRLMFLKKLPDHAPNYLITQYCWTDKALGIPNAESKVFEFFSKYFTVEQLEDDWFLWQWLERHSEGACP